DGYWEFALAPWDVAAISVIVSEAGGRIGNAESPGRRFSLCAESFLFAAADRYDEMLHILQES
ncbi:MAG: hypothetical protein KDD44_02135, partial [Bdellovibrionales bacterium]|nr:hypothetical protein [Bdellovibrionales bacterium]